MGNPVRTTAYPELAARRIRGSKALTYLVEVADGKAVADPARVQACRYLVNKVVPDAPQQQLVQHDGELVIRWKS